MKFYDTNALLDLQEEAFTEKFYISSVTLEELESIKTSSRKDPAVKYAARKVVHLLEDDSQYTVVPYDKTAQIFLDSKQLEATPDNKICACAYTVPQVTFVTGDLCCRMIAKQIFGLKVESVTDRSLEHYSGYLEVELSDEEIAELYANPGGNDFGLLINQYLIVHNKAGELVDAFRWTSEGLVAIRTKTLKSKYFGEIKPCKGDIYQRLVIDSFTNNQVTMVRGPAGTGKSLLSMGYLFSQLEKHVISKIIVFCNTPKTMNSVGLGLTDKAPLVGNCQVQIS